MQRTEFSTFSAEGTRDQYADGRAAKVWELFIGDRSSRTDNYKNFLIDLLRDKGCRRILDVACGTGYGQYFKGTFLGSSYYLQYSM